MTGMLIDGMADDYTDQVFGWDAGPKYIPINIAVRTVLLVLKS